MNSAFNAIGSFMSSGGVSILLTILIFGLIVLVHEFGHFIAARRSGILVEEFAIGMGPKLLGFQPKETLYSIRLLPFGGYCKMLGEDTDNNDPRALNRKPAWKRLCVMLAGVVMNIALALLVFLFITCYSGYTKPVVSSLTPGFPAEAAGIKTGDQIVKVGGSKVRLFEDVLLAMYDYRGGTVKVEAIRGKERITFDIIPAADEYGDYKIGFSSTRVLGMFEKVPEGVDESLYERIGLGETLTVAWHTTWYNVRAVYKGLAMLITGKAKVSEMSGPVGIGKIVSEAYTVAAPHGFFIVLLQMLSLVGMLSVNLAVLNLLPVPGLDGGRSIFILIEMVRKKPINPEKEGLVHLIGFGFLMLFAVFILFQDIFKLFFVKG